MQEPIFSFSNFPKITQITFGSHFDQPLPSFLPSTLYSITFTYFYSQPLNLSSLPSLSFLEVHLRRDYQHDLSSLPLSLSHFTLYCKDLIVSLDSLPPHLSHLTVDYRKDKNVTVPKRRVKWDNVPSSLSHLVWGLDIPLPPLPSSLLHIVLTSEFNQNVDILPSSLFSPLHP